MPFLTFTSFLAGVDAERAGNEDFLKFVEQVLMRNDVTTVEQVAEVTADTICYDGVGSVSGGAS